MTKQYSARHRPLFVCLTNIPNTYRLHEFECLNRELVQRDIDFEVIFMAHTEYGRHWTYHHEDWPFRSYVARGIHPQWNKLSFHINPGVVPHLLQRPPTWLLIGGGWTIPTGISAVGSAKMFMPKTTVLFWVEATLNYTKYSRTGWLRSLKRTALFPYDGFVVPGKSSVDYVQDLFGSRVKPSIQLPNFVDENVYSKRVLELRKQRNMLRWKLQLNDEIVFLLPARLIPEKGIAPFLSAISGLSKERFSLLLAGDGPLEAELTDFITRHGMSHVKLLGHQDLPQLLELYALSDALVLPSPREPYGFVAVEALWAGLPLILSNEIGALPEVLNEGENGWCFSPSEPSEIVAIMSQALDAGRDQLEVMGLRSQQIAHARFAPILAARAFVNDLLNTFPVK